MALLLMSSQTILHSYWKQLVRGWQQWSIRNRGSILITIPMVSLLSFSTLLVWVRVNLQESAKWVSHTQIVLLSSNQLLKDVLSAEIAARGYYIVQSSEFLGQYRESLKTIPQDIAQLEQLVKDNPQQSVRVGQIRQSATQKFKTLSDNLRTVEALKAVAASPSIITRLLMESEATIRLLTQQLKTFETEEQRLLDVRQKHLDWQRSRSETAVWLCAGVGFLSSVVALYVFRTLETNFQQRKGELMEHQYLISAIASNIIDGIITLDQLGRIKSINLAAADMFGMKQDEAIGKMFAQLLPSVTTDNQNQGIQSIYSLIDNLGTPQDQRTQTMGLRRDGNFFPIDLSISELNKDSEWIAVIHDITERQQSDAKLQARADELADLAEVLSETNASLSAKNRELSQFSYVASHDLKAPLRAISNLSAWIEEDLGDQIPKENQEQFRLLRGRVQRMEALITGLLEYSRVGGTAEQPESTSIADLLAEVIKSLNVPGGFDIAIDPKMPTFVTRRLRLGRVFTNLIANAVKHHNRQVGKISITVRELDQFYEFSVSDDGPGIAPQYHQKVFTIFQTLQARDKVENTGIGLSIVKKTVETEGGTVQILPDVVEGSTFRFTWPRDPISLIEKADWHRPDST
jgi:PAS domain S-box-containing protein